jgi:tetratricopeptide (TPR) repeat protein
VLVVAAGGSVIYAWHQLKTNEVFFNSTLRRATVVVDEAVAQGKKYNVPRAAMLSLLAKAEGLLDDMAHEGRHTPELRYRKAWMLIQFARNYAILGDTGTQLVRASEAYRLLAGLAAEDAKDIGYQRGLSFTYDDVGDMLEAQGKLTDALQAYRGSLVIRERLAKADPGSAGLQRDLLVSHNKIGDLLVARGHLTEALEAYRDSLTVAEHLWQHDVYAALSRMANVEISQGDLRSALANLHRGQEIMERLVKVDPGNPDWQRDLSVSYSDLALVHIKLGDVSEALTKLRNGREIIASLVAIIPSKQWKKDLAWFDDQIARLERQTQEAGRN